MMRYKFNGISPENRLNRIDEQIAETNREFILYGEKHEPDTRAVEMVKETGKYAKKRGVPVSDYVYPKHDINQLTKLLAKGVSKKSLADFYKNQIKDGIDEDAMPQNYNEALQKAGYFFNGFESNGKYETLDPYQNVDLKNFFDLPTEEKVSYIQKFKKFGKKAVPVALATVLGASILATGVAAELTSDDWDIKYKMGELVVEANRVLQDEYNQGGFLPLETEDWTVEDYEFYNTLSDINNYALQ